MIEDLYNELKKEHDSGNIKPTQNTQVKQTVENNGLLENVFSFIKNKISSR